MSSLLRISLVLLAAASVVAAASPAHAESPEAVALKKRGNQAMVELDYGEALDLYRRALKLDPDDASLHYNLGRALQARAEFPEALDAFEAFKEKASPELRARVPKLDDLIDDVRSRVASIAVTCTASLDDARIVLREAGAVIATADGCGTTPRVVRASVPKKTADVEVGLEHPSKQAKPVSVTLTGGAPPVAVALEIAERATSGLLRIRAVPAGARVSVDGRARGVAPLEVPVAPGPHTVDVSAPRHETSRIPVIVSLGVDRNVDVELARTPPVTARWWFWAGAAVLAVGAGVTAYVLVAQPERAAPDGSIAPGQSTAPLRF